MQEPGGAILVGAILVIVGIAGAANTATLDPLLAVPPGLAFLVWGVWRRSTGRS